MKATKKKTYSKKGTKTRTNQNFRRNENCQNSKLQINFRSKDWDLWYWNLQYLLQYPQTIKMKNSVLQKFEHKNI